MHSKLNPEEFLKSLNFITQNLKSKQKSLSPKEISNYIIKEKVGQGSFATVYKAIHKPTNQIVAVKILDKTKMTIQEIKQSRFEVQTHKKLFHTNIARIYQFYQDQQKMYIFIEYCQNGQLFNYINQNGPLSQKSAAKIFKGILSAMKYLKSQRLFHRDIKCQNIMFDHNWNPKLIDFGFAIQQDDGCYSSTFCGSPSYSAPELAKKQKYHSQMIDVWCIGVTLYAMIASQLPFDGKSFEDTKKNIMELKYQMKKTFSNEVKQIFRMIFVQDTQRASIQQLEQTDFYKKGDPIHPNYINSNIEEICLDNYILQLITNEFYISSYDIIDSVKNFKLNTSYSLYYLTVQRQIMKGRKVRVDIASVDFQKKKKRSNTLKLIKIRDYSRTKVTSCLQHYLDPPQIKSKKQLFRIRFSQPISLQVYQTLRNRNQSSTVPKKLSDSVSAYPRKI